MTATPDYKERMKDELKELETKLAKLNDFLDSTGYDSLSTDAKVRIVNQRSIMMRYVKILKVRIERD